MNMKIKENTACTRFCNCLLDMIQRYGAEAREECSVSEKTTMAEETASLKEAA